MAKNTKKIKIDFLFVAVIIIFIILRFCKTRYFFQFGVDEEYQALLGWSIIKNFHIVWIGVSASNIGYYLGPGLVYLTALLLRINKDPIILGYFASFVGLLTFFSIFYIAKNLYGRKTALIAVALYTFSPLATFYDQKYWPIGVPLVALWLFYSLIKSQKNQKWLLPTAFFVGISYHLHITLWIFWPFIITDIIYKLLKNRLSWKIGICSLLIFFISTLPLLVFDFVHNFDNLKMPIKLLMSLGQAQGGINIISRLTSYAATFLKIFFPSTDIRLAAGLLLLFFLLLIKFFGKNKFITGILTIFSLGYVFFPSPMQEYYFVFALPFVIILTAIFFSRSKKTLYVFLGLCIIINIYSYIKNPLPADYSYKVKIINQVKNCVKNNPFSFEVEGSYLYFGGWRYLFQSQDLVPAQSSADQVFGWIYPDEISKEKPKYEVKILKDSLGNYLVTCHQGKIQ